MSERDPRQTLFADFDLVAELHILARDGEHLDRAVVRGSEQQRAVAIDRQPVRMPADIDFAEHHGRRCLDVDDLEEIVEQLLLGLVIIARRRGDDRELAVGRHGDRLRRALHRVLETFERARDHRRRDRGVDHDQAIGGRRLRERGPAFDAHEFPVLSRHDDVRGQR